MKKINKLFLILPALITVAACTDEDKNPFPLTALKQAAVLRTLSVSDPSIVNKSNPGASNLEIEIEADDFQGNTRFESMDVFISFVDTFVDLEGETATTLDDENISVADELLINIPASSFTIAANGKPQFTAMVNGQDAIELLGLTPNLSRIDGGDIFRIRLAMNLVDGSVYTSTNVNGNVTGQFFASGFRYDASVVCILDTPPTGDWTMNLLDSYGDGWDGAFITVEIDGSATDYTVDSGSTSDFTVNVPDGTQSLNFTYTAGSFEEEHSFIITAPSGNIVKEDGPVPTAGTINLNLCNE